MRNHTIKTIEISNSLTTAIQYIVVMVTNHSSNSQNYAVNSSHVGGYISPIKEIHHHCIEQLNAHSIGAGSQTKTV